MVQELLSRRIYFRRKLNCEMRRPRTKVIGLLNRLQQPNERARRVQRRVDKYINVRIVPCYQILLDQIQALHSHRRGSPCRDPLSRRVIHIRFSAASVGSSMTALPISLALARTALAKNWFSLLGSSVMITCGCMKLWMWPRLAPTLISIRKSVLHVE